MHREVAFPVPYLVVDGAQSGTCLFEDTRWKLSQTLAETAAFRLGPFPPTHKVSLRRNADQFINFSGIPRETREDLEENQHKLVFNLSAPVFRTLN